MGAGFFIVHKSWRAKLQLSLLGGNNLLVKSRSLGRDCYSQEWRSHRGQDRESGRAASLVAGGRPRVPHIAQEQVGAGKPWESWGGGARLPLCLPGLHRAGCRAKPPGPGWVAAPPGPMSVLARPMVLGGAQSCWLATSPDSVPAGQGPAWLSPGYCWWECKFVWSLYKTVLRILKN